MTLHIICPCLASHHHSAKIVLHDTAPVLFSFPNLVLFYLTCLSVLLAYMYMHDVHTCCPQESEREYWLDLPELDLEIAGNPDPLLEQHMLITTDSLSSPAVVVVGVWELPHWHFHSLSCFPSSGGHCIWVKYSDGCSSHCYLSHGKFTLKSIFIWWKPVGNQHSLKFEFAMTNF